MMFEFIQGLGGLTNELIKSIIDFDFSFNGTVEVIEMKLDFLNEDFE